MLICRGCAKFAAVNHDSQQLFITRRRHRPPAVSNQSFRIMKTKLTATLSLLPLSWLLVSCLDTEQYGLPQRVYFGEEGGTQVYHIDDFPYLCDISIETDKEYAKVDLDLPSTDSDMPADGQSVTLDWLTVTYRCSAKEIELTAKPMAEGRHRNFRVEYFYGSGFATSFVNQTR